MCRFFKIKILKYVVLGFFYQKLKKFYYFSMFMDLCGYYRDLQERGWGKKYPCNGEWGRGKNVRAERGIEKHPPTIPIPVDITMIRFVMYDFNVNM
jgi:hypothetical protein